MKDEIPGEGGLIGIAAATVGTCIVLSMSGVWIQWLPCAAGLYAGWLAVKAINGRQ